MPGGEDQPPKHEEQSTWSYHAEGASADESLTAPGGSGSSTLQPDGSAVEWSAPEFIVHEKSPLWYVTFTAVSAIIAAGIYLFTHDLISLAAVVILAIVSGVAASRKPRTVHYQVDRGGITVGRQFHPYGEFKSFAVVDEGAVTSITILPLRRIALPLSIYFSPEDERRIMEVLASHLPMEPGELTVLDHLMRNVHF